MDFFASQNNLRHLQRNKKTSFISGLAQNYLGNSVEHAQSSEAQRQRQAHDHSRPVAADRRYTCTSAASSGCAK
jgi:hypothetical protein